MQVAFAPDSKSLRLLFAALRRLRFDTAEKESVAENLLDVLEIVAVAAGEKPAHLNGNGFRSEKLLADLEAVAAEHGLATVRTQHCAPFYHRKPNYAAEIQMWKAQRETGRRFQLGDVLWIFRDANLRDAAPAVAAAQVSCGALLGYPSCCVAHNSEIAIRLGEAYVNALKKAHGVSDSAAIVQLMERDTEVDLPEAPRLTGQETRRIFPYVQFFACPACLSKAPSPASRINAKMRALAFSLDREFAAAIWKAHLGEEGAPLPNRNALCPCGSGKKFKRCCGEE